MRLAIAAIPVPVPAELSLEFKIFQRILELAKMYGNGIKFRARPPEFVED